MLQVLMAVCVPGYLVSEWWFADNVNIAVSSTSYTGGVFTA